MAAQYILEIDAGATCVRQFKYTDQTGAAINLTGYTAVFQMRTSVSDSTVALAATPTIDGPNGTVTLTLTGAQTGTLTGTSYVYAIELTAGGGEPVIRLVDGQARVSKEVVR